MMTTMKVILKKLQPKMLRNGMESCNVGDTATDFFCLTVICGDGTTDITGI